MPSSSISIHALLAESDSNHGQPGPEKSYFYPRSPCGERLLLQGFVKQISHFYPRSPCGERPMVLSTAWKRSDFYPRSPCGERRTMTTTICTVLMISIHALLAESDIVILRKRDTPFTISIHALLAESDTRCQLPTPEPPNFYPRSPCGERRHQQGYHQGYY